MADLGNRTMQTVILVHGTGAAADSDNGARWWQIGSPFWAQFNERLHRCGAVLCEEVFHWTGLNKESERIYAGRELLANHLLPLEERRQPYHLIGHSHGGSAIWEAIQTAEDNGIELSYLRSWSTVGTPFIHYAGNTNWFYVLWATAAAILWAAGALGITVPLFYILAVLDLASRENILVNAAVSAVFGVALVIYLPVLVYLLTPSWGIKKKRAIQRRALSKYGDYWFGLWSRHDEVINVLAVTPQVYGSTNEIKPRWANRSRKDQAATLKRIGKASCRVNPAASESSGGLTALAVITGLPAILLLGFFRFLIEKGHDVFVAPWIDRKVWKTIAGALQGNDMEARIVSQITSCPVDGKCEAAQCPSLPDWLEQALLDQTEAACHELPAKLRLVLGQVAATGGADVPGLLGEVKNALTWRELVHTAYFDNADCRELLALHIEMKCDLPISLIGEGEVRLQNWLRECKRTVNELVVTPCKTTQES
jgi:hypothetical protein